jgi:hypothetical protein
MKRIPMLGYKRFVSFLVPVLNQPLIKLLLTLISLAFYFLSLDLLNSLMTIVKRRLNYLINHLQRKNLPEDEQD